MTRARNMLCVLTILFYLYALNLQVGSNANVQQITTYCCYLYYLQQLVARIHSWQLVICNLLILLIYFIIVLSLIYGRGLSFCSLEQRSKLFRRIYFHLSVQIVWSVICLSSANQQQVAIDVQMAILRFSSSNAMQQLVDNGISWKCQ